jgi:hypothetical protein
VVRTPRTLHSCGHSGLPRVSCLGTQHFYHKPPVDPDLDCVQHGESWEHLQAKAVILLACRQAGYEASTEFKGDNWTADVLARKGDVRIAFEVQLAGQSLEETLSRQQRLARSGVRGCWFFRRPPRMDARKDLPLFQLAPVKNDSGDFDVLWAQRSPVKEVPPERRMPLNQFVQSLLGGRVRFCPTALMTERCRLRVRFYKARCVSCHRPFHYYRVEATAGYEPVCRATQPNERARLMTLEDEADRPEIRELVDDFLSDEGRSLKMGTVKPRHSAYMGGETLSVRVLLVRRRLLRHRAEWTACRQFQE